MPTPFPQSRRLCRAAAVGVAVSLLAGCAIPPPLHDAPALRAPDSIAATSLPADPAAAWPGEGWWRDFGDDQLTALIERALKGTPSLAIADARLHQAAGYARAAHGGILPQANASGSAGDLKQSYNEGIPPAFVPKGWNDTGAAQASLAWDLDLFGRNHATLRAAVSERTAAWIEAGAARNALATAITNAYAELGRRAALRDVAAQALRVRQETATLVARRVANGLDTLAEQRQAEAAVPTARADLAAAEAALTQTRNMLAALLGDGPDAGAAIAPPPPGCFVLVPLPARLTLDLVGRRADIAAARARAEAAASRVGAARAAFFPDINLSAFFGVQSLGLANLTDAGSQAGQAQAAISLPLFQGGALRGNYNAARGGYELAVAQYNDTLVQAVRDVADAAAMQTALAIELTAAQEAVARNEEAFGLARRRYEGGLSPYLSVLSAEDSLLRSRQLLADTQGRVLAVRVAMIRALGGGFSSSSLSSAGPQS